VPTYKMNDFQISKYYYLKDFQCPCCQTVKIANRLVELLDEASRQLGMPLKINSAYRCPKHNAEVGGVPNSYHTQGLAVDLELPSKFKTLDEFAEFLRRIGFKGIGIYRSKGFVHADLGGVRKWEE